MCHGFGAASFVSCDRCGGSGKRSHDIRLSSTYDAPPSDRGRPHCCGVRTASTEGDHALRGCGKSTSGGSSGPHVQQNRTGSGAWNSCSGRKEEPAAERADVGGLRLSHSRDCAKCKGTGRIPAPRNEEEIGHYCTRCAGTGFIEAETELVLPIPAGVEAGQIAVYANKGHVDLAGALDKSACEKTPSGPKQVSAFNVCVKGDETLLYVPARNLLHLVGL